MRRDLFNVRTPIPQVFFRLIEDLACRLLSFECWMGVAWNDRTVIKEVQNATRMLGKQDLLLSALYGCSEVNVVGFLELLARL